MQPTSSLSKPESETEVGMNIGTCILLIFLLIVAAFAGLGYLVPELNQKTAEVDALKSQLASTRAELESLQKALTDEQAAHETTKNELGASQARLRETELALQTILAQSKGLQSAVVAERAARQKADENLEQAFTERSVLQLRIQELESQVSTLTAGTRTGSILSEFDLNSSQSGSTTAWLLSLVILVVSSMGSYRIALSRQGHLDSVTEVALPQKQVPLNHQESDSQLITVRIPRERVTGFSKWLRTGKV
jgi:Skp family chaperone for outer membrane proteins